ncbi:MAG: hemerythrin domain-containing protein [Anaeromyxobacter sp.]|nr:hemerythrin domain-containing protein [Anaeromyxobacter sp.]MBL0278545.1 hemerythrin domain-containing protein [Anaeromyxobacter sp.]
MAVAWSPELTLRHEELDRQHRGLFQLLEAADVALRTGAMPDARRALAAFCDAMLDHTVEEGQLMEASLFPDRERHRAAHDTFLADLQQLQAELAVKGPTPDLGEWLRVRVIEWLRFHIAVNDTRLAEHLARSPARAGSDRRPARRPARRPPA